MNNSINKYNHLIENRYEDESHDSSRPLIKPSDLFLNCEDVMNFTESIKKIDANEIDYSFESFKKVEEAIQKHEFTDKKIVLMSSVPSEIEKLKEKYRQLRDQKIRERVEALGVKTLETDDRETLLRKEREYLSLIHI